jgi:asparagine synthase (glutamine-hydrolysing)
MIVAWARIDHIYQHKDDLLSEHMGAQKIEPEMPIQDASKLILDTYLKHGKGCCRHLIGDYSFVIYDPRDQTVMLARDHVGVKPLYYYFHDDALFFSSSARVFKRHPRHSHQL